MKILDRILDRPVDNKPEPIPMYTEEQLMARLKFFIGICLALTLVGIVFVVLYSIIFVTQPHVTHPSSRSPHLCRDDLQAAHDAQTPALFPSSQAHRRAFQAQSMSEQDCSWPNLGVK